MWIVTEDDAPKTGSPKQDVVLDDEDVDSSAGFGIQGPSNRRNSRVRGDKWLFCECGWSEILEWHGHWSVRERRPGIYNMPSVPGTCVLYILYQLYQAPVYHTSYTRHLCTSCIRHLYFLGPAPVCIEGNYCPGVLRNLPKALRTLSRLPRGQLHSLNGNSIILSLL